ncbi:response regulator [Paenibacillus sp. GD4]|uniref:response regulator transcription factor n=1 Tax=Paenibacillus sp. GD4 TaxID=3068890 RepID=UPI002796402D|nr:response regulator [Paenibacillus sp. GD4]MDQ1912157.1 response regulator [Paenibacillus sp. GD4]
MMYRVLIVDDEPEIRMGLRLKADWERLQLTVVGEASNGAEALERLGGEPIDIVITDMNMPVMDGVSFLDACQKHYPSLRLLVITGYEDFHYAKAAIKHQARDYLLKPVAQDELNESLGKVVRELERERNQRDEQATVQWKLSQYYRENKENFLVHLVKEGLVSDGALRERAKLFELDTLGQTAVRFVTAGLVRTGTGGSKERTPESMRVPFEMLAQEFAETYASSEPRPVAFRDPSYPGLVHFVVADADDSFCTELRGCVAKLLGFEPAVGSGQTVTGLPQWKEGYSSSLLAWSMAAGGEGQHLQDTGDALSEETVKVIERYLSRGELDAFGKAARQELEAAYAESRVRFVKLIFQLYLLLEAAAHAARAALPKGEPLWLRPDLVWGLDTVGKAVEYLLRLAQGIKLTDPEDAEHSLIQSVRQFIDENYMYDLNLTLLAERFRYNPSYFSELFKAKVGKTFIQYLTEVRMAKAVRLLEDTSLNLWDIAELTGFSNASYFSSKFKKMHGVTPSEFRSKAT